MRAHFNGFVIFNGTGMGLLLGDPDFKQHVENRLALDFQFSGQIVNSNLAHPLCFLRTIPLSLHINLTVSVFRCASSNCTETHSQRLYSCRSEEGCSSVDSSVETSAAGTSAV